MQHVTNPNTNRYILTNISATTPCTILLDFCCKTSINTAECMMIQGHALSNIVKMIGKAPVLSMILTNFQNLNLVNLQ